MGKRARCNPFSGVRQSILQKFPPRGGHGATRFSHGSKRRILHRTILWPVLADSAWSTASARCFLWPLYVLLLLPVPGFLITSLQGRPFRTWVNRSLDARLPELASAATRNRPSFYMAL